MEYVELTTVLVTTEVGAGFVLAMLVYFAGGLLYGIPFKAFKIAADGRD
jgi:hypothetical protein